MDLQEAKQVMANAFVIHQKAQASVKWFESELKAAEENERTAAREYTKAVRAYAEACEIPSAYIWPDPSF